MPSNISIKFKKKVFNQSTDSSDGVVVFDSTENKIYVGGVCYSSDVKDASWNQSTNTVTFTKSDNTTISLNMSNYESVSNKVTSLSSQSTDTQYPSAKCVYDLIGPIDAALDTILNGSN